MLDKKVAIVGYSGHAFVVADAAISAGINITQYTDKNESERNPFKLKYIGFESETGFFDNNLNKGFILGIGDNKIRETTYNLLISKRINVLNVIHPSSQISKQLKIGKGNFVSKNTAINPLVTIEDACIINTGAIIEHECYISKAAHIGPGVVLAGNVYVGERSFIGANTVIKEGVSVGSDVVIGADSVVLKDVSNGQKIAGNPAKSI